MDTLNERIKQLRKEKGLTQSQLADLLGVTDKAVSKWEIGETNPDISLLPKMSEIFNVTLDYLLVGKKEEKISIDDMDAAKRLHYIVKNDDVDSFIKYKYDGMSKDNNLFTRTIYAGNKYLKKLNINVWKELVGENANKILSYAFDRLLQENNFGYCLAFLAEGILDDLIKKAIDLDRVDVIESFGVRFARVKKVDSNKYGNRTWFSSETTFKLPFIIENINNGLRFDTPEIEMETLKYFFEHKDTAPKCFSYITRIELREDYVREGHTYKNGVVFNGLEEEIIQLAINEKYLDLLEKYDDMFYKDMLQQDISDPYNGIVYHRLNNYITKSDGTAISFIIGRMRAWEKEAIDAVISAGDIELAERMMDHNKYYIKKYKEVLNTTPNGVYIIPLDEMERQFSLANHNLNDSERFMLQCIKNSCIDKDEFIKIRDLKLARNIIDNYPYCEYDYIYTCIKEAKNKELFKFFINRDDEANAEKLMAGEAFYNDILRKITNYIPSEVKVTIYEKFKKNNSFREVDYDSFVRSLIANKDLLNDNPVIELIKQLKDDLYKKVQELVEADKKAEEERIEIAKIVKGLTKDYFDNLLRNNGEELFYIKLCSLLDAIFKFDFHYTGEDFSERMNAHFKALENAPSENCYFEDECDVDDGVAHLKDIFNRLRIERNNIAHSEHQDVKKLTQDELKECLEYVFSINKEVE